MDTRTIIPQASKYSLDLVRYGCLRGCRSRQYNSLVYGPLCLWWQLWTLNVCKLMIVFKISNAKVREYDQEIQQLHTTDQPTASWGRASTFTVTKHPKDNKSNQLSLPRQEDWKTRMDIKSCIPKQIPTQTPPPQTMGDTLNNKSTTTKPPP